MAESLFRIAPAVWSDTSEDEDETLPPELLEAFLQPETPPCRFAPPTTAQQIEQAKQAAIPEKNTKRYQMVHEDLERLGN